MKPRMRKVVFITGASSGIGRACAEFLLKEKYIVFGSSRKANDAVSGFDPHRVNMLRLDIRDPDSIRKSISYIIRCCGKLDVVINNAGFGIAGSIEDVSVEKAKELFDTNFFGTLTVIQEILQVFRKQSQGLLINISSLAGRFSLPFQSHYAATKFALEAVSESLFMELKGSQIKIAIVEPTDISTNFTESRQSFSNPNFPLSERFKKSLQIIERDERKGSSPWDVAKVVGHIVGSKKIRLRYTAGKQAWFVAFLNRWLPDRLFLTLLAKHYGL